MNTKKLLAMVVAVAMVVAAVPMFGLVASAADFTFAGPFTQTKGQTIVQSFGPVSGEITITYDVVFNETSLTTDDFVGFGSTAVNGTPTFANSAIGMQGAKNDTANVGFRNGGDWTDTFEAVQGETYSVTITTDTADKTYSGTVVNSTGDTVLSFEKAAYRATKTENLDAFFNLNNGGKQDRVTVSNLVISIPEAEASVVVNYVDANGEIIKADVETADNLYEGYEYTPSTDAYFVDEEAGILYTVGEAEAVTLKAGKNVIDIKLTAHRKLVKQEDGSYNLVTNGGFETGDFTGWTNQSGEAIDSETLAIVEDDVSEGKYALSTAKAGTAAEPSIANAVTAPAAAEYFAAVDVKGTTGNHPTYQYMDIQVNGTDLGDTFMYFSTDRYTTFGYVTSVEADAVIRLRGSYFQDAHPLVDNFVVYQLAYLDTQTLIDDVKINYTIDGKTVATASTGTSAVVGDEITVPAGIIAPQYYLEKAATVEVPASGEVSVEVIALSQFTLRAEEGYGVWATNGSYNEANFVNWNPITPRYAVMYVTLPEYDAKTQDLVLTLKGRYNNGTNESNVPAFPIYVADEAAVKAIDLTVADYTEIETALNAIDRTKVASSTKFTPVDYDNSSKDGTTKITLDLASAVKAGDYAIIVKTEDATEQGIFVATEASVDAVDITADASVVKTMPSWDKANETYDLVFEAEVNAAAGAEIGEVGFYYGVKVLNNNTFADEVTYEKEKVTDNASAYRLAIKGIDGANALRSYYVQPYAVVNGKEVVGEAKSASLLLALSTELQATNIEDGADAKVSAFQALIPVVVTGGVLESAVYGDAADALKPLMTIDDSGSVVTLTDLAIENKLLFTTATKVVVDGKTVALTGEAGTTIDLSTGLISTPSEEEEDVTVAEVELLEISADELTAAPEVVEDAADEAAVSVEIGFEEIL